MKFCLLDAGYDGNKIKLFGLNDKGESVLVIDTYQSYLYILAKTKAKVIEKLKKSRMVEEIEEVTRKIGLEETKLLKVFVDLPQNLFKVRDLIKHSEFLEECYEYTIPFYKRYLIDKEFYPFDWLEVNGEEIKEKDKYKKIIKAESLKKIEQNNNIPHISVLALDIEVVDNKIIMLSLVGNNFQKVLTYKKCRKKYCEVLKNEKELLERMIEIINEKDPDIITGFNSDQFDFEIIRERCDEHKIQLKINRDDSGLRNVRRGGASAAQFNGRIHIDLFNFINNILAPQLQFEALALADVSEELLGESKLELSFEELVGSWKEGNIDYLAEYCLKDSVLTKRLFDMLWPQIIEISKVSGQMPFDSSRLTYGLLVEWFFVRKSSEMKILSPNQPHWNEIQKRRLQQAYKGGYVREPKLGLHDDIAVFDFRSLYPSIIVTFNISPETLNCDCCKKNGYKVPGMKYHYCRKKKGFIPQLVNQLIDERIGIKNNLKAVKKNSQEWIRLEEQQKAIKILANASYGLYGFAGARWYCRECAESSSAFGRYYIQETMKKAENSGFTVLYGDTDSLMVTSKENFNKKTVDFLKKINKELPGILDLELQGIYKKGLFVPQKLGQYAAKKRYALIDNQGNVTVRGFEAVRRDWCYLAKTLQHDILRLVLKNREKEAIEKVKSAVEKVKKREVSLQDLAIRTMLGKPLDEYKATAPHVAVAKKLEKEGHEVRMGMVLSYIITKRKGSISEKAELIDKVTVNDYDIDYYIQNQILSVSLRVLKVLGYDDTYFLKKEDLQKFLKK